MTNPTAVPVPPKRRWRHRIPKSLRQHWKLPVVFVLFVVIVASVFGATTIRPYITGDADIIASEITDNITGTVDLFDTSVTHELSVEMSDAEYNDMITSFQKGGDKKWITADVVIDDTRINDISVRLKGNSTLMGVRGISMPDGPPEGAGAGHGGPPPGMDTLTQASADDPTSLPLLISFDENADGRAYQGMTELSVRPGSPVLNESMALSLTAATNQPTQRYAYMVYSVNDSPTATRLVLEHPDDTYANSLFDSDGYLYKADASSRLEYRGDDQSAYADQFKQINAVDTGNLQPLIDFLRWLDSADNEEFNTLLTEHVDVKSLAKYLATQNLLVNADDMSGPGQNYYLWYDLETKKFSVVSWDLNLAMIGDATLGPEESASMGPGRKPDGEAGGPAFGGGAPGGPGGKAGGPAFGGGAPGGPGGEAGGPAFGDGAPGGPGGKAPRIGNKLKERFLESDAFTDLYDETYWELYDQIYGNQTALRILDELSTTVPRSDELSAESLRTSVDSMRSWVEQRTTSLGALRQT
ncbi:spore coat protein CotH [Gordonia jinghuaiqii]|uniref:CotH kinase family protein n=1 Tax=Gordonia jinghuaiqii TaxID=2758710 RepID=A0A7D7LWP5_9ACTN|nr:CotH kinase family protein [Gordonia jinghuaiqii]MCR5979060.1 spore coat protein CotH [Gordonia jinghuaiqii]QMT01618.1 CotH kinase family protein [Gordonia jinghuaiqii]